MKSLNAAVSVSKMKNLKAPLRNAALFAAALAMPELAMAAAGASFKEEACTFLDQIVGLLGIASIAVVTIAIVFAGYQIAFAHKRISDVAPILIGGLLIGGAGQLAGWILQKDDQKCSAGAITMIDQATKFFT